MKYKYGEVKRLAASTYPEFVQDTPNFANEHLSHNWQIYIYLRPDVAV